MSAMASPTGLLLLVSAVSAAPAVVAPVGEAVNALEARLGTSGLSGMRFPKTQQLPHGDARNFLDDLLDLLHQLGYSDQEIVQVIEDLAADVVVRISQLPPRDVMILEAAAGDLLAMLQSGQMDLARLQADFDLITSILGFDRSLKPGHSLPAPQA